MTEFAGTLRERIVIERPVSLRNEMGLQQRGVAAQVTARDGARATIACLRMLESARIGQPLKIDLDAL